MNRHNQTMTSTVYDQLTFSTYSGENGSQQWEVTRQGTVLVGEVYYARQNQKTAPARKPTETEFWPLIKHLVYRHGGILAPRQEGQFAAFFPDTSQQHKDVLRAINCALTIAEELSRLNEHRSRLEAPPLRISLGVDVGMVQVRTTTQGHSLQGGRVDTAVCLSELNKQTPFHTVFISETVQAALGHSYDWHLEHLGAVSSDDLSHGRSMHVYAAMRTPNLLTENAA